MTRITDAVKQHEELAAQGKLSPAPPQPALAPPFVPSNSPIGTTGPSRGSFQPSQILATDFQRANTVGGAPVRSPVFPFTTPPSTTKITNQTTVVQNTASTSSGPLLEINGVKNPSQSVLNLVAGTGMEITTDAVGDVTLTSTASGDGLTHGTTPWEIDPAYFIWRDDFSYQTFGDNSLSFSGSYNETGWRLVRPSASSAVVGNWLGGVFPHFGVLQIINSGTSNDWVQMMPMNETQSTSEGSIFTWPLLDYGGWQMTWIFEFLRGGNGQSLIINNSNSFTPNAFSLAKTSCYIGLGGVNGGRGPSNGIHPRPDVFLGLRYDTDAGTSLTLSSVANASAGTTVYTGTITNGGTNLYEGRYFTVAGFTNSGNNGRFLCVANTTTTLTLQNSGGISESHAATATTDAISDTTMKFEYVTNPNQEANSETGPRNNTQGQVFNTGVTPTEGSWYRLDMACAAAGVVTLTLSGGGSQLAQEQITCSTVSYGNSSGTNSFVSVQNGVASFAPDDSFSSSNLSNMLDSFFGIGSKLTVSSTTSAFSGITGSQTCMGGGVTNPNGGGGMGVSVFSSASSFTETQGNLVITGFPGLVPFVNFGNDTSASPTSATKSLNLDFFSFIWNPALASSPLSVNSGYSRYLVGS